MSTRVLYLCEGSSDRGISLHIERIGAEEGVATVLTVPDFNLLPVKPGSSVSAKLRAAKDLGGDYDLVVVHRDSDRDGPEARRREIENAIAESWPDLPHIPAIPVRMLEAWLLLDEQAIRQVAQNPKGRVGLNLPKPASVEAIADPKAKLKDTLALASELQGARLQKFQARFSQNRARLLEMLDPNGAVSRVPSWATFTKDLREAFRGRG
ncbi:DUF4276 family protein [Kitasatospora sp. NPDC101176]|uniref:DUF4276 family protein n=1 Tax=Kitasatospora sp. NPDC101176 TaxID=3364099 RepID=UPI0037F5AA3C